MDFTDLGPAMTASANREAAERAKIIAEKVAHDLEQSQKLTETIQKELYEKSFEKWLLDNCDILIEDKTSPRPLCEWGNGKWIQHNKKEGKFAEEILRKLWKESQDGSHNQR